MLRVILSALILFSGLPARSEVNRQAQTTIPEVSSEIDGLNRNKQDSINFGTRAPNSSDRGTVWMQYTAAGADTITQHYRHPVSGAWVSGSDLAIKGWINFDTTGTLTINDSSNVTSVTDTAAGDSTVNWDTDFANALYAVVGSAGEDNTIPSDARILSISTLAVGTSRVSVRLTDNSLRDVDRVLLIAIGDQ